MLHILWIWQMYYNIYHYGIIKYFFTALKSSILHQFISPYQFLATTDCFIVSLILPFSRMSHSWNHIVHRLFRFVFSSRALEMPGVICPWGLWSHPRETWTPSWWGPITHEKAGAKVISEGELLVFCGVMLLKLSITSWTTPHSPILVSRKLVPNSWRKGILETLSKCIAALLLCVTWWKILKLVGGEPFP